MGGVSFEKSGYQNASNALDVMREVLGGYFEWMLANSDT
jgi:hypothetical protein